MNFKRCSANFGAWGSFLLVCLLLAGCTGAPVQSAQQTRPEAASILITVKVENFRPTPAPTGTKSYHGGRWQVPLFTRDRVRRLLRQQGLRELEAWPIRALNLYCVKIAVPSGIETAALLERLNSNPLVVEAQENQNFLGMTRTQLAYDDPLLDVQYGERTTMIHSLHASSTGHDVRIGIIDSNVDLAHPDLQGQINKSYHLVDNPSSKGLLHGTAVTGVIGAAAGNGLGVAGLAPGATLIVYGACGGSAAGTRCTTFALAKALAHALDDNVSVLNVSLAGPRDSLLEQLINAAVDRQIVLVAAINPNDNARNFPANHRGVHAVGSTNKLWFARSEQMTTQAGGGYRVFSGSSIAAAGMSGAAALLRSQYSASETNRILRSLLANECASTSNDSPIPQLLGADGCS